MKLILALTCLTLSLGTTHGIGLQAPVSQLPTCRDLRCPAGEECVMEGQCVGPRCPPQFPRCKPIEKPGVCPINDAIPCEEIIDTCSTDSDCPGADKCCSLGCGNTCVEVPKPDPCYSLRCSDNQECRVVTHPCLVAPCPQEAKCVDKPVGKCPFEVTDTTGIACQYDRECPAGLLCCQNSPGSTTTTCMAPEPPLCEGIRCPAGQECVINSDVVCKKAPCSPVGECRPIKPEDPCNLMDCKPGDVCISQQVQCAIFTTPCPLQGKCVPENKLGRCPRERGPVMCDFINQCESDYDCKDADKCCVNSCGRKCTRPITVIKRGRCPALPRMDLIRPYCPDGGVDKCSSDGECPGAEKCCTTMCGKACVPPQRPRKYGICPVIADLTACEENADQCQIDSECLGGRKCCLDGCGKTCLRPRRHQGRPRPIPRPMPLDPGPQGP